MKGKIIRTGEECRKSIQKAVNVAADVVGSTLGPRGRNVCINKLNQAHITKDGVSVVKEIYLNDEVENLALSVLKQSSLQTLNDAGDGTTTCLLLAQSIYNQGMKYIASQYNPILLKRGMDYAVEKCVEHLKNKSIKIEDIKQIEQVATISANGDQNIGALISKAVDKVGKDGKIVIDENSKPQIDVEYEEGMVLDRGYISPLFVNKGNEGRATCEFDDAFMLPVLENNFLLFQSLTVI
jgi:chaperonin GroEL